MMDQQPENQQEIAAAEAPVLSVGATLREARERMGLSVADVVNRLKFAPRQIEALEKDDYAQLPEAAFVRGFVRSYARLLQLDEKPLLAALPGSDAQSAFPAQPLTEEVPFPGVYSLRRSNIIWLAAALAVAVILALFAWLHDREPRVAVSTKVEQVAVAPLLAPASAVEAPAAAPTAAPVAVPAAAPAVAPAPAAAPVAKAAPAAKEPAEAAPKTKRKAPSATGVIRMTFDEDAWVEVKDKDGQVLMSQINPAGTEQGLDGNAPFTLTIGHAGGVKLYYKGKPIDLAPSTSVDVAHVTLE